MMSKSANLLFDSASKKWVATFGGQVLASSVNKNYVIDVIRSGRCKRAAQLGISNVISDEDARENSSQVNVIHEERFSINERFDFLSNLVQMVAERSAPSLIVTGEGGLGKTHTVIKALKNSGLKPVDDEVGLKHDSALTEHQSRKIFTIVKGYSTAKGLYRTLFENRNKIIVFDDCDSVLRDAIAQNLLKGALDSYDRRIISWNAESFGDDDLPRSFEFKGGIIFISNLPMYKIDQAVRSRSLCVDLTMNLFQKIERMRSIVEQDEFLPEYDVQTKRLAVEFIDEMKNHAKELSLRTLISVVKVAARGGNWRRLAEYVMISTT